MTNRITNHRDLLFPVRTVGVFAELCEGVEASRQRIPGKKAIVNCTNGRVISVVSDKYQVVTNRDAVDYAFRCCKAAFPEVPEDSWDINGTDAPLTGGHCHFDLTHSSAKLQFDWVSASQRPDAYGPFIRVTNSYNRKRALGFNIGFMRKVCSNGMILPQSSISFSLNHNTKKIPERIEFETSKSRFQNMKASFLDFLDPLQKCPIPSEFIPRISLLALRVQAPENPSKRAEAAWTDFNKHVESLSEKYACEIGENAYALLNVVSDLASRPAEAGLQRRERHSLQRLAGAWLARFSSECKKATFHPPRYVEQLKRTVAGSGYATNGGSPSRQWTM